MLVPDTGPKKERARKKKPAPPAAPANPE